MSMRRSVLLAILSGLIAAEALAEPLVSGPQPVPDIDPMMAFLLRGGGAVALIVGATKAARRAAWFGADSDAAKLRSFGLAVVLGMTLGVCGLAPSAPMIEHAYPVTAQVMGGIVVGLACAAGVTASKRAGRVARARRVYSKRDAAEVTDRTGP